MSEKNKAKEKDGLMNQKRETKEIGHKNRDKAGRIAILTLLVTAVLLVSLNLLFSVLEEKNDLRIDMTRDARFSLSKQTEEFLETLPREVEVLVLASENDFLTNTVSYGYTPLLGEILQKMAHASAKVSVRYVDPVAEPEVLRKYSKYHLDAGDVLVVSGERDTHLTPLMLLSTTPEGEQQVYINSSRAELVLLSAMKSVTTNDVTKVGVLAGFDDGNNYASAFSALLQYNAYEIEEISLLSGEISQEFDLLILAGPHNDLTQDQIEKLEHFLENDGMLGKTMLYFAAPTEKPLPNLAAFLKEWGVEVGREVIYETDTTKLLDADNPLVSVPDIAENLLTPKTIEDDGALVFYYAFPVNTVYDRQGNRSTFPLVYYTDTARLYHEDGSEGEKGPFHGVVVSSKLGDKADSTVVTVGAVSAISDSFLNTTYVANASFFVEMLDTVFQKEDSFVIEEKVLDAGALDMTAAEMQFVEIIFIMILPIAVLITGLVEWISRRRS